MKRMIVVALLLAGCGSAAARPPVCHWPQVCETHQELRMTPFGLAMGGIPLGSYMALVPVTECHEDRWYVK